MGLTDTDRHHLKTVFEYFRSDHYQQSTKISHSFSKIPLEPEIIINSIKQMQKLLNREEVAQIVTDYKSVLTVYQLADKYDCNRRTISAHLKAVGIEPRLHPLSEALISKAVELYATGLSCATIGKKLGVSSKSIYNKLIYSGIKMFDSHGKAKYFLL